MTIYAKKIRDIYKNAKQPLSPLQVLQSLCRDYIDNAQNTSHLLLATRLSQCATQSEFNRILNSSALLADSQFCLLLQEFLSRHFDWLQGLEQHIWQTVQPTAWELQLTAAAIQQKCLDLKNENITIALAAFATLAQAQASIQSHHLETVVVTQLIKELVNHTYQPDANINGNHEFRVAATNALGNLAKIIPHDLLDETCNAIDNPNSVPETKPPGWAEGFYNTAHMGAISYAAKNALSKIVKQHPQLMHKTFHHWTANTDETIENLPYKADIFLKKIQQNNVNNWLPQDEYLKGQPQNYLDKIVNILLEKITRPNYNQTSSVLFNLSCIANYIPKKFFPEIFSQLPLALKRDTGFTLIILLPLAIQAPLECQKQVITSLANSVKNMTAPLYYESAIVKLIQLTADFVKVLTPELRAQFANIFFTSENDFLKKLGMYGLAYTKDPDIIALIPKFDFDAIAQQRLTEITYVLLKTKIIKINDSSAIQLSSLYQLCSPAMQDAILQRFKEYLSTTTHHAYERCYCEQALREITAFMGKNACDELQTHLFVQLLKAERYRSRHDTDEAYFAAQDSEPQISAAKILTRVPQFDFSLQLQTLEKMLEEHLQNRCQFEALFTILKDVPPLMLHHFAFGIVANHIDAATEKNDTAQLALLMQVHERLFNDFASNWKDVLPPKADLTEEKRNKIAIL